MSTIQMDSTHAAVGIGGVSATTMIAIILTGWHGLTVEQANAWAWLITSATGSAYAALVAYLRWKWPTLDSGQDRQARSLPVEPASGDPPLSPS